MDDIYIVYLSINNDILYLMGWLDVGIEFVIVSILDFDKGCYWILYIMDMGYYIIVMIGVRMCGIKGGCFMFVLKFWKGIVFESVD